MHNPFKPPAHLLLLLLGTLSVLSAGWPEPPRNGVCLGPCQDCYDFLADPPTPSEFRNASLYSHDTIVRFIEDPSVCQLDLLFRLHPYHNVHGLAAAQGGMDQFSFPNSEAEILAGLQACRRTQQLSVDIYSNFLASEASRLLAPALYDPKPYEERFVKIMRNWQAEVIVLKINLERNYSTSFSHPVEETIFELGNSTAHNLGLIVQDIKAVSFSDSVLEVPLRMRNAMDRLRLTWALKTTVIGILSSDPALADAVGGPALPRIVWHPELYGRHWDMLKALLTDLTTSPTDTVHMSEVGCACGTIPVALAPVFPNLHYKGMDPNLPPALKHKLEKMGVQGRVRVWAATGNDIADGYVRDKSQDLVFIDGPHTYARVSEDVRTWLGKVRNGGIIAGHDFTCQHPPLLWAVYEMKFQVRKNALLGLTGGWDDDGVIHAAMDGVWWWRVNRREGR